MSGVSIIYNVKGANSASGNSISDSTGVSRFCYTAQSTGRDTIIASYENIYDTAFVVWDYPLPVELSSFTSSVSERDVTLSWSTVKELNNSRFDIERAFDNEQMTVDSWSKIGNVNGNGTVSEPRDYTFTDKNLNSGNYKYRLKQVDFNGNFDYFELEGSVIIGIPDKFSLSQNYPNPFNPVTNLEFGISELGLVSIKVYDALGREEVTLVNEIKEPGYYTIKFNAANLASGVYFTG
ncbi:MAG: T9SS type A sorting domain-containing protein [Ignavibacteria bacterium]